MNPASPSATEILPDLVRIPSVSGAEEALAEHVAGLLRKSGLEVERPGGSILCGLKGGEGPRLLLNSHLDTVPAGAGWSGDPWRAQWHDGRLVGLGANDAKASVAALLAAVLALAREEDSFRGEVLLALTVEEETTNRGMGAVLARTGLPDGAVTAEPTGLEVVRAQSGLAVLEAEWRGVACHAAHAASRFHRNALLEAAEDLTGIAPFLRLPGEHPLLGSSTAVPTRLRAGERSNVVPDCATAIFDARLAPPHAAEACRRLLEERLPGARVRIRSERLAPVETPEDHPFVQIALRAAGRERALGSNTLSDMALLGGLPAVKCGPGDSLRSHTPDEFVLAGEVESGAAFFRALIPAALRALAGLEVSA